MMMSLLIEFSLSIWSAVCSLQSANVIHRVINMIAVLCRSSIVVSGCIGQLNKGKIIQNDRLLKFARGVYHLMQILANPHTHPNPTQVHVPHAPGH